MVNISLIKEFFVFYRLLVREVFFLEKFFVGCVGT